MRTMILIIGWQNFFICIEMCLAAIALRFAFPHQPYMSRDGSLPTSSNSSNQGGSGAMTTMQTISHNLKETMNPKDIMHGRSFALRKCHHFEQHFFALRRHS